MDPIQDAAELADNTIELLVGAERMRAARLEKLRDLQEEIETLRKNIRALDDDAK
jgi:hypothetical protein